MSAPLSDVRVVELATFVAVPAAGALLADLGAEVIKVEVPAGEVLRHSIPKRLGYRTPHDEAPHYHMDNRGKRSLALDLSDPASLEALHRVVDGADVLLSNMLPHRLERFGLDAKQLRARHPELIHASLSGYGPEGPEARTPAFDYTAYWARTGLMDQLHELDGPPAYLRPGVGDHAAALALVSGVLSALRVRERGGSGQDVSVNLMHMGLYIQGNDAAVALTVDEDPPRHDRAAPRNPLWNHYRTADDRWVFLCMIESDRYWPALCRALEHPEWESDERFESAVPRYRNSAALTGLLADCFAARPLAAWEETLTSAPIIWAPVRTLREAAADPQAEAMGMIAEVPHPAGAMRTVAPPVRLSGHPMPGDRPGPALGADSQAVLREAGLAPDEIHAALGGRKEEGERDA